MIHDARHLLELAAYLVNDTACSTTYRFHGHGAKQEGHQAADEQADQYHVIGQIEAQDATGMGFQRVRVVSKQYQGCQAGRTDGVTLGYRLGGVTHGVQRVGDVTDLLIQIRHLGDAACIIGNRTIGIQRHDNTGHGEHGGCRNRDAVEAGQFVRTPDGRTDNQYRRCSRLHGNTQTGNYVGTVTGSGRFCDMTYRLEFRGGVVLGDEYHGSRQAQANQRRIEQVDAWNGRAGNRDAIAQDV